MRKIRILTQAGEEHDVTRKCPRFFDCLINNATFRDLQEAEGILEGLWKANTAFKLERGGKLSPEEKKLLKRVLEVQKTIPKKGGRRK